MKSELLSKTETTYETYDDYLEAQVHIGLSYESENALWKGGQKRYIEEELFLLERDLKIADIACGDGVGLECFRNLAFKNIEGFELCEEKAKRAEKWGYPVFQMDIHDLSRINNNRYDVIYSSHTLEHLLDPVSVLSQFKRILKDDGVIYIVLPYGEHTYLQEGHWVHCGVSTLGLNVKDEGKTLKMILRDSGFYILDTKFDSYRESEIWLKIKKWRADLP